MKKIAAVIGTRPEAIKLWPLIGLLKLEDELGLTVVNTGQHGKMLDDTLVDLGIKPDSNLQVLRDGQSLTALLSNLLAKLEQEFLKIRPDVVVVQGDTISAFAAAVAAFLMGIKVAHVEAGLRTQNKLSPFPEEFCRQSIARIADLHLAPTSTARQNLLCEGISDKQVKVTGNTVVDAAIKFLEEKSSYVASTKANTIYLETFSKTIALESSSFALVTLHRRENAGPFFEKILLSICKAAQKHPYFQFVFPVHPNPKIFQRAYDLLGHVDNVHLVEPQKYSAFMLLLSNCKFVLSDSGGIQEEAVTFKKPILVARNDTERSEGLHSGLMTLLKGDLTSIVSEIEQEITRNPEEMLLTLEDNPFGDGKASERIVFELKQLLLSAG